MKQSTNYYRNLLKRITDNYNPEYDLNPNHPPIPWYVFLLANIVLLILDELDELKND